MPASERRQIENEMIFRRANEKVGDDLDKLDAQLMQDDCEDLTSENDMVLHFICECSDEDCDQRLPMRRSEYLKIHKNRSAFIIKPDHQVDHIEKVILKKDDYCVVEKNNTTPEPDDTLNTTSVDNT